MDRLFFSRPPVVSMSNLVAHTSFILRETAGLCIRHPVLCMYQKASSLSGLTQLTLSEVFYPYHTRLDPWGASFGLTSHSLLPAVRQWALDFLFPLRNGVLFRHYLFIIWSVVALAFLARHRTVVFVSSLVGLSYFAGFLVGDVNPEWRYLLPTYLCAWVGLMSFFLHARAAPHVRESRP